MKTYEFIKEGHYRSPGNRAAYGRDQYASTYGMRKHDSEAYRQDGGANDEGHSQEPQRPYQAPSDRPVLVGMYFYNVPAGQEDTAAQYGVKQTKSGKWAKAKYTTSGRSFDMQKQGADREFGQGRWWQPQTNESQLNELSPQTLADYKKAAGADASTADKDKDYERGNKRFRGIVKATKREFDNDTKKHKVDESELSEEMIAQRLKRDLDVFKKGQKKDTELSKKPADKDIIAKEDCWKNFTQIGMKDGENGKPVPNCIPKKKAKK
jgi:hypothetical protein